MKHINDNRLCTIAFRTTGPVPFLHDLVDLAVVPLAGLALDRSTLPFNMHIQPQRVHMIGESIPKKRLAEYLSARPPHEVEGLFERWYGRLGIPVRKRLIPIGYNLHQLYAFLVDLFSFSPEGENFVDDFFDFSQARSLETITHSWNDLAWSNKEPYPFQKHQATYAAFRLGYLYDQHRPPLAEALMYREIWERVVNTPLRMGIPLRINYPKEIDYDQYNQPGEFDDDPT